MTQTVSILCLAALTKAAAFGTGVDQPWWNAYIQPSHLFPRRGGKGGVFPTTRLRALDDKKSGENGGGSSYESSGSLAKGIVSSLTSLANSVFQNDQYPSPASSSDAQVVAGQLTAETLSRAPPTSSQELLSRIRDDYVENNYLWTGELDTTAFVSNCTFTDPTISFVGLDKYVENVGSLVPVVDFLLGKERNSRSELLDIMVNEEKGYVKTRWNMVGEFNRLPWRPKIDVIGKTKFWYGEGNDGGRSVVQVYFYDEAWEIPAGLALLQLVTPAGTIANTGSGD